MFRLCLNQAQTMFRLRPTRLRTFWIGSVCVLGYLSLASGQFNGRRRCAEPLGRWSWGLAVPGTARVGYPPAGCCGCLMVRFLSSFNFWECNHAITYVSNIVDHPCIHACIHAYIHACIHVCILACIHASMHASKFGPSLDDVWTKFRPNMYFSQNQVLFFKNRLFFKK